MERFIHSCWLKTPPTQAPISLGSQTFRDKLKIVAAKEARFSIATISWICARKASKAKFLNRMFDSRSSMKKLSPHVSAQREVLEKRVRSNPNGLATLRAHI